MAGKAQSQGEYFHTHKDALYQQGAWTLSQRDLRFTYTFDNFFHPFVGELIDKVNRESLAGLLDPVYHDGLRLNALPPNIPDTEPPDAFFKVFKDFYEKPENSELVRVEGFPKEVDVSEHGPYSNYNWELLFHIPLTCAVHLSKNRRFAEAQRWFHYIFDPTCNDTSVSPPKRFWKFLRFRHDGDGAQIDDQLALLSKPAAECTPDQEQLKEAIRAGYDAIKNKPFRPHAVARTRHLAYRYCVVMKYLDNLLAWGDHLFRQDTIESINEATQLYVLAANLLGARPERIPPRGTVRAKTFAQLKAQGLDPMSNVLIELEGKFPFNFGLPQTPGGDPDAAGPLFGIGPTLYFCVPPNEKLLSYWDTVADRLFKIRHCMTIEGVVRQLALFDAPIDPGILVKAAAAGIGIGSILSGLNQPIGPVRSLFLIQKALELAGEVRGLGNALLSAIEKGDAEHLALVRQGHEIRLQQMAQDVRFLQWKQAQESTESLLRSRAIALERYRYYLRLLGQTPDINAVPETLQLDRPAKADDPPKLTEETFDEAYAALVGQYEKAVPKQTYPQLTLAGESLPANQSGASGQGALYLNTNEDQELNEHAPESRRLMIAATVNDAIAETFVFIPDVDIDIKYLGIGGTTRIPIGELFSRASRIVSSSLNTASKIHDSEGASASRTASYERRADDWILQANGAAGELMHVGRQIIGSLIAEQVAHREYLNTRKQIELSRDVDRELRAKFSSRDLYAWMQGEITRLYYEYYRFAFDTARRAEQAMKRELMRPEVDATDYVTFNYWDSGRKGPLSGEALYLDVKRMEMAYHENNRREYEVTKNVSLRQVNPLALLTLKAIGACEVTLPEWLFDLDNPGHYMRRLKNVSLSIPSVTGPYTSVSCTVSLLKSSLRRSPVLKDDDYGRQGSEDDRFVDYFGTIQSIVTSSGTNDSGMFETNLRDERFLPFEGAGAESTWRLELPAFRQFDYNTVSDVILHLRYTAREGGSLLRNRAVEWVEQRVGEANASGLAILLSLKHEFPGEWHRFVMSGTGAFTATVKRDHFPYFTKAREITIDGVQLYAIKDGELGSVTLTDLGLADLTGALNDSERHAFELTLAPDTEVLSPTRGRWSSS